MKTKPTYQELERENEILRKKLEINKSENIFSSFFENNKVAMLPIDTVTKQITDAKKAELTIKKNHKQLRTILNAFKDGVYLCSPDYEIEYLNSEMRRKIGYKTIGKKCYKAIYDLEKPCSWCYFDKLKQTKSSISIDIERDNRHYVVTSVLLENDSKLTVYHDITKIKEIERALKTSETRFKQLSNLTFEGILIHNNGIVIDTNLSFTKMFGYNQDELLGKSVIELLSLQKYHKIIFENIAKSNAQPYEIEGIKKDGTIIPLELQSRPIDENSTIRVVAVRDITERKKARQELIIAKEKAE